MAKKQKSDIETEASLHRAKNKLAKIEEQHERALGAVIEKGAMTVTAIVIGAFDDKIPITVLKVPTKLWVGGISYGIAAATQKWHWLSCIFEGVGDAHFAAYDFKSAMQVKKGLPSPFVAGEEEEEVIEE